SRRNARSKALTSTRCISAVNRVLLSLRAASLTHASFAGKGVRICVRPSARLRGSPSSPPLPSAHLVSFGGIIGTMSGSDSRPQLGALLWSSLAMHPHGRPVPWPQSGLLGSDDDLPHVMRSLTSVERHRLA